MTHWLDDPYWSQALSEIRQAMEDGARFVQIDVRVLDKLVANRSDFANRIFEAMKSDVMNAEAQGTDSLEVGNLLLALLWRLQEKSMSSDSI